MVLWNSRTSRGLASLSLRQCVFKTSPSISTRALSTLKVNQQRLWDSLHHTAQWGDSKDGGVRRLTLTPEDKAVREWFVDHVQEYGAKPTVDQMGSIFAVRPGENNDIPPIGIGSHLDTQPAGGRYDGILGVHAGIEVLRVLQENNHRTYAPLAVINWTNEEGARFNTGMLASGVWSGQVEQDFAYALKDADGKVFRDELESIGFLGEAEASHNANPLSAHFEYHIEQGPILEEDNRSIGIVTGVQGMGWLIVTVTGRSQHCGTTPMDRRSDALLTASRMISRVNEIALEFGGMTTVGVINSEPQSPGTIPGKVVFSIDFCHLDNTQMDRMVAQTREECAKIAEKHSTSVDIKQIWRSPGVVFDDDCVDCVRSAAVDRFGKDGCIELPAGAGHDSVNTSYICPTAMVFIPSKNGISHHPSEYSSPEDCANGAQVLLDAVLRYDTKLRQKHGV